MYATGEDDHFIFPQKFSSTDHSFVYADDDDNIVGVLQTTPEGADTLEFEIPDQELVDTMGDDMMEAMERKKYQVCDDFGSRCGEEHEMDDYT